MSFTSIFPYFLIMAICFFLAGRLKWLMPSDYFERAANQKYQAIEGLRSLLALSVFFHHSVITYFFYQHGRWEPPPSTFFSLLGGVSINIFFMITGFLFWGKAIQSEGRIGYKTLLPSRIRRIAPAYMVAASLILAAIFWETGFTLREPAGVLLEKMAKFLFGLGLIPVVNHPINGISAATTLGAGVFWTLAYEWRFYLALPLLALLLRKEIPRPVLYGASLGVFIYVVVYNFDRMPLQLLFLCGMLCAALNSLPAVRELLTKNKFVYLAGLASIPAVFLLSDFSGPYPTIFLLTLFFLSLVHMHPETIVYKLLQTQPAKILGACSYSTYVLHGAILHIGISVANRFSPISSATPLFFWAMIACIAIVVVVVSILSYRFVEHPFMLKRVKN
jgi:peptidoglycan/LPS O-acetylase OafA/YrhL